ncbi:hypothetical protein D3C87_1520770 [compost metagenome]
MQAVEHQAAARCKHIAKQGHLWAAESVEYHVHATVIGDLVDLHQQILFFGDDDFLGTEGQQVFPFIRRLGRGNHPHTHGFAQLDERRSGTVTGVGDQGKLPGLDPCQIGVGEIGDQQRRVMHTGFDRTEDIRVTGQRRARQHDLFAVDRIVVGAFGREAGDLVTDFQVIDTLAERRDHAGHFMAKP